MMSESTEYQALLNSRGVSLERLGSRGYALERSDALLAVKQLREATLPILGGDVYYDLPSGIEFAYAAWSCSRQRGEELFQYLTRSWSESESYIRTFPEPENGRVLFALVVGKP
jgi:hypothetical protein